jgi:hypothetical protein
MTKPKLVKGNWTCPPGYAHPKCKGCGHNYFEMEPQPKQADGSAADGGRCHWCQAEDNGTLNTPDYVPYQL